MRQPAISKRCRKCVWQLFDAFKQCLGVFEALLLASEARQLPALEAGQRILCGSFSGYLKLHVPKCCRKSVSQLFEAWLRSCRFLGIWAAAGKRASQHPFETVCGSSLRPCFQHWRHGTGTWSYREFGIFEPCSNTAGCWRDGLAALEARQRYLQLQGQVLGKEWMVAHLRWSRAPPA